MNKRKFLHFGIFTLGLCLATSCLINASTLPDSFSSIFASISGDWVHYKQALPGTVAGTTYGVREYWVRCGGGYQFSAPTSEHITEADNYDVSEFATNDPRYIIPIIEDTGSFKSVLLDLSNPTLKFNEINELSSFTNVDNSLPTIAGNQSKVLYKHKSQADSFPYYYANTIAYTHVYSNWNEMKVLFGCTGNAATTALNSGDYIDGYYALACDFSATNNISYSNCDFNATEQSDRGFRGVFDGRGHTITESNSTYAGGLFCEILGGTIKNLTISDVKFANDAYGALAAQCHNGSLENVRLNITNVSYGTQHMCGLLVSKYLKNSTLTNVVINAYGKTIENVFGGYIGTNTYSNVKVIANAVNRWGGNNWGGNNISKPDGVIFQQDEQEIIIEGDPQDIIVNSASTQSLNLGSKYSSVDEVQSITLTVNGNSYSLGNHVKSLNIPADLIAASEDVGVGQVKIRDNAGTSYIVSVCVITKVIENINDLTSLAYYSTNTAPIYGYYILKNDLTFDKYTTPTDAKWNGTNAFKGTLDGRNHSLTVNIASTQNGLFGVMINATVKDIKIVSSYYNGYGALMAYYMSGCTFDNVDISIASTIKSVDGPCKYLFCNGGSLSNTFKDVDITAYLDISSMFYNYYANDTYTNSTITVASLNMFADNTGSTSAKLPPAGVTLIETKIKAESLMIDKSKSTYTLDITIPGTLTNIVWNGSIISTTKTIDTSVFGSTFGEAGKLTINYVFNSVPLSTDLDLLLVNKVITTRDELDGFIDLADAVNGVTGDGVYDGYFVLGNDITWSGSNYNHPMAELERNTSSFTKGFLGTFDGLGYKIDKFSLVTSGTSNVGLVSCLGNTGVIKNLAFTNVTLCNSAIIAGFGNGLVENIFVSYPTTGITHYADFGIVNVSPNSYNQIKLHNCLADARNDARPTRVFGKCYKESLGLYQNCYALTSASQEGLVEYNRGDETGVSSEKRIYPMSMDGYAGFDSYANLLRDAGDDIDSWDYFSYVDNVLKFGSTTITTTAPSTITSHNFMEDYVIVYDSEDKESIRAAALIETELMRASGTVTYTEKGNSTNKVIALNETIKKVGYTKYNSEKNLIVVGNKKVESEAGLSTTSNRIAHVGNSAFIMASDSLNLLGAAYQFLSEVIGYQAFDQDYIVHTKSFPATLPAFDQEFTIDIKERLVTNGMQSYGMDKLAINIGHTGNLFSAGPIDNPSETIHNCMDWLPYETYGSAHPKWYRTTENRDLCWTAQGDSTEYTALVNTLASRMYDSLLANPTVDKLCLGMEDINYCHCSCTSCKAIETNNGSYAAAGINLLNDVTDKIAAMPNMSTRDFVVYLLGYYYMSKAPTGVSLHDHVGVLFAPLRYDSGTGKEASSPVKPEIATSIHDSNNSWVKTQLTGWANLVGSKTNNKDSIGFWFYDTMFRNFFGFTDTFESMITWVEHAVHATNGQLNFMTIQGQSSNYTPTAFEAFKQYINARAMREISSKVNAYSSYGSIDAYNSAINTYFHELENDFFGITSRSNNARFVPGTTDISTYRGYCSYNNNGYYGSSQCASLMYGLYLALRRGYSESGLEKNAQAEYSIKTSKYAGMSLSSTFTFLSVIKGDKALKDYYYFPNNFGYLTSYMNYGDQALTAIENISSEANYGVCKRHINIETLSPRFFICMSNSTNASYGFGNGITYNSKTFTLAQMRSSFKADCVRYGINFVAEHYDLSFIYSLWGIN